MDSTSLKNNAVASDIKKYYWYNFFKNASFWLPIFTIFFMDNGLDYTEILILLTFQSVFQFLFEIPSGAFSDLFGRRMNLICSAALKTAFIGLFLLSSHFSLYCLAYVLLGISISLESGSDIAFISDSLKQLSCERQYKKIEGKAYEYNLAGMGTGGLIGAAAANSLTVPLFLTACAYLISTIIASSFAAPEKIANHSRKSKQLILDAKELIQKAPLLRWLLFYYALFVTINLIVFRFYQSYLKAMQLDLKTCGFIYMLWLFIASVSANLIHHIDLPDYPPGSAIEPVVTA